MSSEVIKILDDLSARFGIAIDWSAENLQPYLMELFTRFTKYELYTSIMWVAIGLVGVLLAVIFIRWAINADIYDGEAMGFGLGVPVIIGMIAVTLFNMIDIIKCSTIPEMFVLEYLKNLL